MTTTDRAKRYKAWAAIGIKSGRVLTDLTGHFSVYEQKQDAVKDCPKYGYVDQVTISVRRVIEGAK